MAQEPGQAFGPEPGPGAGQPNRPTSPWRRTKQATQSRNAIALKPPGSFSVRIIQSGGALSNRYYAAFGDKKNRAGIASGAALVAWSGIVTVPDGSGRSSAGD